MYTVKFGTGQSVQFNKPPSQSDIEEVANKLGVNQPTQPKSAPGLGQQLVNRGQQLGQDIGSTFNHLPGDVQAVAHPLTQGNKEQIGTDVLNVAGDVGGAIKDVAGAGLGLVNKGARLIPGVAQGEDLAMKGIQSGIQSPIAQRVIKPVTQTIVKPVSDFMAKNPDVARAYGSVGNLAVGGSLAMGAASLGSKVYNAFTASQTPVQDALISSGASTDVEAPQVAQTLQNSGLTDLSSHSMAVARNELSNTISSLKNEIAGSSIDSISGEPTQATQALLGQLKQAEAAQTALKQMARVPPVDVPATGLLDKINSGITGATKQAVTYPYKLIKPYIFPGSVYGTYRALGGDPLFGKF